MCEIQWKGGIQEISKKKYYEMLNCLPPREPYHLIDGYTHQFLMGEPYSHININDKMQPVYAQFGIKGKKYFYLGLGREERSKPTKPISTIIENWSTGRY